MTMIVASQWARGSVARIPAVFFLRIISTPERKGDEPTDDTGTMKKAFKKCSLFFVAAGEILLPMDGNFSPECVITLLFHLVSGFVLYVLLFPPFRLFRVSFVLLLISLPNRTARRRPDIDFGVDSF